MPKDSILQSDTDKELEIILNNEDISSIKFDRKTDSKRGSIVSQAAKNTFSFPVFMSSSVSTEYATAAVSLLEQVYVSFLQTAISADPFITEKEFELGNTFEKFKSDTNDYLEYAIGDYQKDSYHAELQADENVTLEFDVVCYEDSIARKLNAEIDVVPLQEFDHYFKEATTYKTDDWTIDPFGTVRDLQSIIKGALDTKKSFDDVKHSGKMSDYDFEKAKLELDRLKKEISSGLDEATIKEKKLKAEKLEIEIRDAADKLNRDVSKYRHDMMARAPELMDETKITKLNTLKPYMMKVQIIVKHKDGKETPLEQIAGVKCQCRLISAADLPEVVTYPLRKMNEVTRKAKWKSGELKFFKDLVFNTSEKKQTAFNKLNTHANWYRRLYELAHSQNDAISAKAIASKKKGGSLWELAKATQQYGIIPNATMVITQNDVVNIKAATGIDMLNAKTACKFCKELFLIGLMVIDFDAESLKLIMPDQSSEYEIHSMASLNKQLSTLDTAGAKTREVFKMLG